ncbi:threonine--tRNA ligase 1, cytoplasmic-like [Macrosteles quadrilineatus]|uniref:threonine--tRNA ligase 1, cytoplasmic-like n=1 Tax=Macrosteles quadrilineatus TaxID=74068 RepID=UPI0023E0FF6D|nr:threonine--tRNA ligase 1, cytoplasmic-like [Macrosteles quadrilineatus]
MGKVKLENSKQTELTPSILQEKVITWCNLKVRYNNERGGSFQEKIIVTLPDGKEVMGKSRRTTPYSVARNISKGLAREGVVAMVDDKLWDFNRPLESSCKLILLKYNDPRAKKVFQNSSALLLGAALERVYGGKACSHLCGETEFCYDMYIPDRKISFFDFPEIENMVKSIVNEQLLFERMVVRKEDVFKFFKSNEYKRKIINELITPTVTMYRVGSFIDICEGPLVQHTGKIKAFKITKTLVTHWKGDPTLKPLQRLCGTSFPDKKKMNQWEKGQKNIIKIDHRSIGRNQELFFFDEMSPGSPFFLPKGTHIFNKLVNFMKSEYCKRGFKEVITPNLFKAKLWEISGLLEHYQSNMFSFEAEEEKFVLKPMNCPGHCLIFDHKPRSWRELPLRLADFGVLHRKECSEGLLGMTRLHRFQQDDAHIFCTTGQIKSEITRALDFLKYVYEVLGLDFHLLLSTRPEKFMGEKALWDEAENQLVECLNAFGEPWKESPGEGAFYGPKIDVKIQDYQQRSHQCATIQLDFQLPIRFGLSYKNQNNEMSRPVIIHQAMLGSVERMIGILAESYEGKWPFWLSPHQAMVIPVVPKFNKYAVEVRQQLVDAGFECLVNEHPTKPFDNKLKNAQVGGYNFILTVGQREVNTETVNVRSRNNYIKGIFTVPEIIQKFQHLTEVKNTTDRFY